MSSVEKIALMKAMYEAAVQAAQAEHFIAEAVQKTLESLPKGRVFVTGFGKASAVMASAFEKAAPPELKSRLEGMVIVPDGHNSPTRHVQIIQAAHPVPDDRGLHAARQIFETASQLGKDDIMVVLVSGGGSSLFCLPHPAIGFQVKQDITTQLLVKGAPIDAMNCVRKHLSAGKGGQLAVAAFPATTISFAISDVPGDDPAVIASGPTVGDESTARQAIEILDRYQIEVPERVRAHLLSAECETPTSTDARLNHSQMYVLATPMKSLQAAAEIARQAGYHPVILGDALEGESHALAAEMARTAKASPPQTALISGGETTVIVTGNGKGGRNAEFIHALALQGPFYGLAADTDGIDGALPIAGGYITPDTLARAAECGIDARASLENNDSHGFFAALDSQVITGPTKTNVNDFRVILT